MKASADQLTRAGRYAKTCGLKVGQRVYFRGIPAHAATLLDIKPCPTFPNGEYKGPWDGAVVQLDPGDDPGWPEGGFKQRILQFYRATPEPTAAHEAAFAGAAARSDAWDWTTTRLYEPQDRGPE